MSTTTENQRSHPALLTQGLLNNHQTSNLGPIEQGHEAGNKVRITLFTTEPTWRCKGIEARKAGHWHPQAMTAKGTLKIFVALNRLVPSPLNPRRYHDPGAEDDLKRSLATHGQLVPILVRQPEHLKAKTNEDCSQEMSRFEVVGGSRRLRAAQALGFKELVAVHLTYLDANDELAFEVAVTDNVDRDSLDPIDETIAILRLLAFKLDDLEGWDKNADPIAQAAAVLRAMARGKDRTKQATATRLNTTTEHLATVIDAVCRQRAGMSPSSLVTNRLGLLTLPADLQAAIQERRLTYTAARALEKLDEAARVELLLRAGDMSVRQLREAARQYQAPARTVDPEPTPAAEDTKTSTEIEHLLTRLARRTHVVHRLGAKEREAVLGLLRQLSALLSTD